MTFVIIYFSYPFKAMQIETGHHVIMKLHTTDTVFFLMHIKF